MNFCRFIFLNSVSNILSNAKTRGIFMINLIQTEFSKLKRQKTIFIITGVLLLFWTGMTFWNYHVPQKNFEDFYMRLFLTTNR